ncbi:hypothetical protein DdX_04367 [Ditylenchus destructor]|uniref:Uncharacterized protein n=1 Tax=Ditylenchus destructor TaxID=166010 RepID=A0AAD4NEE9_9BILA|nr:hypothetical protein DdX_04367 [Ditylenchus destructor]
MSTHLNSDITDVPPQTNEDVNKKQDRNVSKKLTSFGTYTNGKDSKILPRHDLSDFEGGGSLFGRTKREGRDERQTERAPHTSYKFYL